VKVPHDPEGYSIELQTRVVHTRHPSHLTPEGVTLARTRSSVGLMVLAGERGVPCGPCYPVQPKAPQVGKVGQKRRVEA
jgi:hypothetical protein